MNHKQDDYDWDPENILPHVLCFFALVENFACPPVSVVVDFFCDEEDVACEEHRGHYQNCHWERIVIYQQA